MGKARFWLTAGVVACAVAMLLSLGTWQVARLKWKVALIDELAVRVAAEAVAFPIDLQAADDDLQFLRVRISGTFKHSGEQHLFSRTRGGVAGFHLMTPLEMAPGRYVFVDRGWVSDPAAAGISRPEQEVVVEGVIRNFLAPGTFTPDNDPAANMWFNPDLQAMAEAAEVSAVAPVYIAAITPEGAPVGDPPGINLRNNHLGYAITWYSLAVALLGMVAAALFRRKESDAGE